MERRHNDGSAFLGSEGGGGIEEGIERGEAVTWGVTMLGKDLEHGQKRKWNGGWDLSKTTTKL